MATTTTASPSFFDKLGSVLGTVLDKSPAVITALNPAKPTTSAALAQLDAYGRAPGSYGYGSATAPAGFSTAPGGNAVPTWLMPVAYVVGGILVIGLLWKLLRR